MILINDLQGDVILKSTGLNGVVRSNNPLDLNGNIHQGLGISAKWGQISGDLDDQSDLMAVLNDKANLSDIPTVPTNVSAFYNDAGYITSADIPTKVSELENDLEFVEASDLATVATTGDYTDLINTPTIPTNVSDLNNDLDFVESSELATVATTGNYNDLSNRPTIPTKISDLTNDSDFVESTDLATVATTGNYNDLSNLPVIPAAVSWTQKELSGTNIAEITIGSTTTQVYAPNGGSSVSPYASNPAMDGTASPGSSNDYARGDHVHPSDTGKADTVHTHTVSQITDFPTLATVATTGNYSDLSGTPVLATVATSGDYTDLSNKPSLAAVATSGNYSDLSGTPTLATVATSGNYTDLSNTPSLATVATSGDYTDLSNKPTIPTKVSDLSNDTGFITGMTILSYGHSTWADFETAYNANKVVYCRASSNANPGSGAQTRLAFMAYVNSATPTNVEFQYYRSVSSHSDSQQGDQVFVYKLDKSSGWSVTTREAYSKMVPSTGLTKSYSSGTLTFSVTNPLPSVSSADNGKFLVVDNGSWTAQTIPNANGNSF